MTLFDLFREHRLLVCMGPGGVGKTTVSAALAVSAAQSGQRVAVLTIDPARRLASALGLNELGDEMKRIFDGASGGSLDAAMIETEESYDRLIRRLVTDERAGRIFENVVYRAFSRTLARSHAYVAMERLHDLVSSNRYDLIVLDTPPTRSALEILDAPMQLAGFLEEGIVSWFLDSGARKPLEQGGALAARLLSVLATRRLVRELSGFFGLLYEQRAGFADRAQRTRRILMSGTTAFVLVSGTSTSSLHAAEFIAGGLAKRDVPLRAVLFNRGYVPDPENLSVPYSPPPETNEPLLVFNAAQTPFGSQEQAADFELQVRSVLERASARNRLAAERRREFLERLGGKTLAVALPDLDEEPRDLEGLAALASTWRPTE